MLINFASDRRVDPPTTWLTLGKRQFRRLHPDKKIIDCPKVIQSEKSSPTPESPKNHRHLPLPCTVFSFAEKYPNSMAVLKYY